MSRNGWNRQILQQTLGQCLELYSDGKNIYWGHRHVVRSLDHLFGLLLERYNSGYFVTAPCIVTPCVNPPCSPDKECDWTMSDIELAHALVNHLTGR